MRSDEQHFYSTYCKLITLFCYLLLVLCIGCVEGKRKHTHGSTLQEYKPLLSPKIFDKLVSIYANKSLLVIDKLKELDDVFMSLPEEVLAKLPTPKAFRRLPEQVQSQVHSIYYSKDIDFEEKLKKLEDLVHNLPHEQIQLIPIQSDLPGLIEFDVPVLLQFNGQIETHLLRNYLSAEDFKTLSKILTSRSKMPEVTRARLIGKLLKEAYQKNPTKFPLPLGEEDADVPEEIRRLGIHLMFSRNPFDNIDPFTKALKILKGGNAELVVGEKQVDEPEEDLDSWVEQALGDAADKSVQPHKLVFWDESAEDMARVNNRRQPWPRKRNQIQQFIKTFKGTIHDSTML